MQIPVLEKPMPAAESTGAYATATESIVTPQKCNTWEWIGCGAAIAGCAALSGPALIACVAAAAPNCVKCVQ